MKKKILIGAVIVTIVSSLVSCAATTKSSSGNQKTSMFIEVEATAYWKVVYHKDTKVMYAVSMGHDNYGNFTVLVNPDGSPMLYEE